MQANRAFLRRAVRFLVERGVRQFLDIGSGIPTVGNVHEVAQAATPDARVVYVDTDPVAVAHSRAILAGGATGRGRAGRPAATRRRLLVHRRGRRPARPRRTDRPCCSWSRVLHFVPDSDDPAGIVARYRGVAPGSYLALSHASQDGEPVQADSTWRCTRGRARR